MLSRTTICDYHGAFSYVNAVEFKIAAAKSALERAGVKSELVDELVTGHILDA